MKLSENLSPRREFDALERTMAAMAQPRMLQRQLNNDEKRLLLALVDRAALYVADEWLDHVGIVAEDAAGMSRLRFLPAYPTQAFGRLAAELRFADADGAEVTACLSLDRCGQPFALDLARMDRRPPIRVPDIF